MANTANALPTKEFFVEMLTRDIELNDAILDLLDNCLDGVLRSSDNKNNLQDNNYYSSYCADISISSDSFSIRDNCGGIPRDTAENYAFRMGRTPTTNTGEATIGIYGIGMKRAIFKIGKEAVVHTKHLNKKYSVQIPIDWVSDASRWNFPIEDELEGNTLESNGTEVCITHLNDLIADLWRTEENIKSFIEELKVAIQESYSLIIQKGFTIRINGDPVVGKPVELLVHKDAGSKQGIRPYVFMNQFEDVSVRLAIGFYAPMASEDDIDAINETKKSSYDAGITIVCNDRVVLYNDKTYLTGWGTSGVPHYHNQFIGIKGIVIFESTNPKALPMTTTKRGIDHSSAIYIAVKDKICEGLKMFTHYTNQWKGRHQQEKAHSKNAERISYSELFSAEAKDKLGVAMRKDQRGHSYRPQLPKPESEKQYKVIRYSKSIDDIKVLTGFLFGDEEVEMSASTVGEKCFDKVLEEAKRQEV